MVKNLPCNVVHMGSTAGWGNKVPQIRCNETHMSQLKSLHATMKDLA